MLAKLALLRRCIAGEVRALWAWWLEELATLVAMIIDVIRRNQRPRLFVRMNDGGAQFFALRGRALTPLGRVERPGVHAGWPESISVAGVPNRGLALVAFGSGLIYADQFELPRGASGDFDAILALHLERHCPLQVSSVHVARELAKGERGQMRARYWIGRRDRVAEAETAVRRWGLEPVRLGPEARAGRIAGNWLAGRPSVGRRSLDVVERRLVQAAAVLVGVLLVIVAGQKVWTHAKVNGEVRRANLAATAVNVRLKLLEKSVQPQRALAAELARVDAAELLLDLTRRIPADSWLYEAETTISARTGPQLTLTGYTPSASALAQQVEAAPEFEAVEIVGVVPGVKGTALDRVQLTARVQVARQSAASMANPNVGGLRTP